MRASGVGEFSHSAVASHLSTDFDPNMANNTARDAGAVTGVRTTFVWSGLSPSSDLWSDPDNWVGRETPTTPIISDIILSKESDQSSSRLTSTNDFPDGTEFRSITLQGDGIILHGNAVVLGAGGLTSSGGSQTLDI